MKKLTSLFLILINGIFLLAQGSYAPNASSTGTTAIHKDSAIFINWATNCSVNRGWQNILDTTLGKASVGNGNSAIGKSGINGTVSLGDKGEAILTFEHPIFNGIGNDFAIFENAFNDTYLELAFVEVSTDGVNYVRFPNYSETQNTTQIDGFGELEATNIYNLAGKYKAGYSTPFDLEELIDSTTVDINNINFIKIIDVIGLINNPYASLDHSQNEINDPFPTPYPSSGFDLDAVGVIHQFVGIKEETLLKQSVFPNPSNGHFTLNFSSQGEKTIYLINNTGEVLNILKTNLKEYKLEESLDIGFYFIRTEFKNRVVINKVIIQ
jgi:hypothetical protein